jgi:hypothetical protein
MKGGMWETRNWDEEEQGGIISNDRSDGSTFGG